MTISHTATKKLRALELSATFTETKYVFQIQIFRALAENPTISDYKFKLVSFKEKQRPDRIDAASNEFWPMWPAAVDQTLLLDERSFKDIA